MLQFALPPDVAPEPAALLGFLRPRASELLPLAPSATQWHSAAHYDAATLTLVSIKSVAGSTDTFTLHYSLAWHAQLGCSDVAYSGTEALAARFTHLAGQLCFPLPPAAERSTVDEF